MTTPGGANLGTARGTVTINVSPALAALTALRSKTAGTIGTLNQMGRASILAGAGVAAAGGLIAAGFIRAATVAAELSFKMDYLGATLQATDSEMVQLNRSVLEFGATSGFGPREVADAFVELGKAGVTAEEIISGVGKAVITLGQSADIGLAEASSIIVSTQATFQLLGVEAQRTADIIQGAANASLIDVSDFGVTMKYVGNVASAQGIALEDLATAIAEIGNQGIRGSTAGTSLRRMLLQLTPRTDKAKAAMEELGIITKKGTNLFYDQTGSAKSLRDIFGILHDKTVNLTDAKKKDALATIFGDRAIATALAVAKGGIEVYDQFNKQLNESTAAEIAAKRFDNLEGSVRKFRGALETAFVAAGAPAQKPLQRLVENATALLKIFSRLSPETQANISKTALYSAGVLILAGSALVLFGTLMRVVAVFKQLRLVMIAANTTMGIAAGTAAALATGMTLGLVAAVGVIAVNLFRMGAGAAEATRKIQELEGALALGDLDGLEKARDEVEKLAGAERQAALNSANIRGALSGAYSQHAAAAKEYGIEADRLTKKLFDADQNIKRLSGASKINAKVLRDTAKAAGIDMSEALDSSGEAVLRYYETTIKGRVSTKNLSRAVALLGDEASGAAAEVDDLNEGLAKIAEQNIDAEQSQIAFQRAVNAARESIKDSGKVFDKNGKVLQPWREASLDTRDALLDVASAGLKVYASQKEQEASEETLRSTMAKTRQNFIDMAVKMGMSETAARRYADELGLVPPVKITEIKQPGMTEAKKAAMDYKAIIESIPTEWDVLINTLIGGENPTPVTQDPTGAALLTEPLEGKVPTPKTQTKPKIPAKTTVSAQPTKSEIANDPLSMFGSLQRVGSTLPDPSRVLGGSTLSTQSATAPQVIPTSSVTNYDIHGDIVADDPAKMGQAIEDKKRLAALRGG